MIFPMQTRRNRPANARRGEDGYTLLAVVFLLALVTIWMAAALPKMAKSIQRDRELETMHRGKQYLRAIQLYYRKFHAFPPNVDALVKTNEIRFLRKKYIDPMTGKDDWKPIMYGQNKVPIVMGFFGQPAGLSTIAGVGPGGAIGMPGAGAGNPFGNQSGNPGQTGSLGSIFNSQQTSSSPTATPDSGQLGTNTGQSGTDTSNGGQGTGSTGTTATDANGNPIPGSPGTGGLTNGQTFGGAGICGFSPASAKQSILIYKKKDHYNEWEFTYDPLMETMNAMGGVGGTNGAGLGTNTNGLGIGNNNGTNSGTPGQTQQFGPNGNLPIPGQPNSSQPNSSQPD